MSRIAASLLTIAVGIAALGATLTGTYVSYVKVSLKWPLVISGLILVIVGVGSLAYAMRRVPNADRHGSEGVGALLLVFVVALILAPPPLGAAAAADRVPNRVAFVETPDPIGQPALVVETQVSPPTTAPPSTTIPEPLDGATAPPATVAQPPDETTADAAAPAETAPLTGGATTYAYEITLYDFIGYALFAPEEVADVPFELVGFAAEEPDIAGSFRLTRYLMGCCAADAFPLQVTLADPPFVPEQDEWVTAIAVWRGEMTDVDEYGDGVPVLEVLEMTPIDPPAEPYEF